MFGKFKMVIEIIQTLSNSVDRLSKENEILRKHYNNMSEELSKINKYKHKHEGNHYVVVFPDEDTIELYIKKDVNRPNNDDDDTVIARYIELSYETKKYEVIHIGMNEVIDL